MATVAFCRFLSYGEVAQLLLDATGASATELEATLIRISIHGSLRDADVDTSNTAAAAGEGAIHVGLPDGSSPRDPAASPSTNRFFKVSDVCELIRSTASDTCHVMPRHVILQVLEASGTWSSPHAAAQGLRLLLSESPTLLAAALRAAPGPWEQRKETFTEIHGNRGETENAVCGRYGRW